MKGFQFDFEIEAGVNDEHTFTVAFNYTPFSPAKTQGDPDDCHDAEGGEIEDLTVFHQEPVTEDPRIKTVFREVPEFLWDALGLDRESLEEMCAKHVGDEGERLAADEGDRKCDEARERRGVEGE